MGYHISVLRTANGRREPITRTEIEGYVSSSDVLFFRNLDSNICTIGIKGFGEAKSLIWQDGEIWTSDPDKHVLSLMLGMAGDLNARVRGDELETYKTISDTYVHSDDLVEYKKRKSFRRALKYNFLFKRMAMRIAVVAAFIFVALVVAESFNWL